MRVGEVRGEGVRGEGEVVCVCVWGLCLGFVFGVCVWGLGEGAGEGAGEDGGGW